MISRNLFASLALTLMLLCGAVWSSATCMASKAAKRPFVLVIDAGHGGKDAGAVGRLTKEKDINLNVALALGRLVEKNCPDVKVIYTRKTDVFVTLQGRADIANHNKAHLFISVHTNSSPPGKNPPMGAETYTLGMHRAADNLEVAKRENSVITQESNYKQTYHNFDPRKSESYIIFEFMQDRNMQQSVDLARAIQRHYTSSGRRNKGVHQAGFLVLRATSMPSVLTELGFISNPEEERFLHSREGVETLARSIFEGFKAYRQKHYAMDAPADAPSNDEGEAQPLVAENAASIESTTPNAAVENSRDAVRNAFVAPQPVDLSTLKAEVVPVHTRPFGQPAAPVEKSQGETAKTIALPQLPPAVATSTTPTPAPPIPQDTLAPVLPAAPLVAQVATSASTTAQEVKQTVQEVKQITQEVKHTAQEVKKAEPTSQVATQPLKTTAEKVKTVAKETKVSPKETKTTTTPIKATAKETSQTAEARLVFKLQLFTLDHALRSDDRHFKGLTPVEYYEEGGRYKYTYGATPNYEEAKRLKAEIADRFPDAFVVAFLNHHRTELAEAIKLSKQAANGKK